MRPRGLRSAELACCGKKSNAEGLLGICDNSDLAGCAKET